MKLFPALILPLTALLAWPAEVPAASVPSTNRLAAASTYQSRGIETVVSAQVHGTAMLVQLSSERDGITRINLVTSLLSTSDGQPLANTSVRAGDRLTLGGQGEVLDNSQHLATMRGVICHAPAQSNDTMAIEHDQICSVLVDTQASTHYSDRSSVDRSSVVTRLSLLQEGDVVQIRGVYDSAAEEMTQTRSIARLGPVQTPVKETVHHA